MKDRITVKGCCDGPNTAAEAEGDAAAAEEYAWLDEDGICKFPDAIQRIPNGIYIASGFTDILELVTGVVYNKPGPGFDIFPWDVDAGPIPPEILDRVLGLQMDTEVIKLLQKEYGGRGILLGESDGDIQDKGLTPAEWAERYGSNGVAAIARQRLFCYANKGGVATPGGAVHGTHQTGHAFPSGERTVKIGGKDGRQYP